MADDNAQLAKVLYEMQQRIKTLERAQFLRNASIDDGALQVKDAEGNVRQVIGAQPDGTYTITDMGAPPPPTPGPFTVTATTLSLTITYDGSTNSGQPWPADFLRVEAHLGDEPGFTPVDATMVATFTARGGRYTLGGMDPGTYYVKLLAQNTSGVESPATAELPVTVITSDGVAPAATPAPTVESGIGVLHVSWDPVINGDPVYYEVHVSSDGSDFTPSPATLVGQESGTSHTIRQLPNGQPVVAGDTPRTNLLAQVIDTGFDSSTGGLESNGGLGLYAAPASYLLSSAQIRSGTSALKITWAAPTGKPQWVNAVQVPTQTGDSYWISAWVYVPTGSPDVEFATAFSGASEPTSVKDEWVRVWARVESPKDSQLVGLRTSSPVAGGVVYTEGWMLEEALEGETEPRSFFNGSQANQMYAVKIVAKDADGSAVASTVAVGDVMRAGVNEISAAWVYAGQVFFDQMVGGTMRADVTLSGRFKTADAGARVEIGNEGLKAFNSAGIPLTQIGTDGLLQSKGSSELTALTATGQASFRDPQNEITRGGGFVLRTGVTAPTTPGLVSVLSNPAKDLTSTPAPAVQGAAWVGIRSIRYFTYNDGTNNVPAALVAIQGGSAPGSDKVAVGVFLFVRNDTPARIPTLTYGRSVDNGSYSAGTRILHAGPIGTGTLPSTFSVLRVIADAASDVRVDVLGTVPAGWVSSRGVWKEGSWVPPRILNPKDPAQPPAVYFDGTSLWTIERNTSNQAVLRRYDGTTASGTPFTVTPSSTVATNGHEKYPSNMTPTAGNTNAYAASQYPGALALGIIDNRGPFPDWSGARFNTAYSVHAHIAYEFEFKTTLHTTVAGRTSKASVRIYFYDSADNLLGDTVKTFTAQRSTWWWMRWELTPGDFYPNATKIRVGFEAGIYQLGDVVYFDDWSIRQIGGFGNAAAQWTLTQATGAYAITSLWVGDGATVGDLGTTGQTVVYGDAGGHSVIALSSHLTWPGGAWSVQAWANPYNVTCLEHHPGYGLFHAARGLQVSAYNTRDANGPAKDNTWYFQHSWFNQANGYETGGSPFVAAVLPRRTWWRYSTGAPIRLGESTDPDQIRVYTATSAARTRSHLVAASTDAVALETRQVSYVPPNTTGANSPHPEALPNPFPASTPALITSEDLRLDGSPKINLTGAGGGRIDGLIPPGSILLWGAATAPAGWLLCDGRAVPREDYPDLFAAIGTTHGAGDGSTTFNLPPDQAASATVGSIVKT